MSATTKHQARLRRRRRVRAKVRGTAERPRLSVFRSNRGIQAQLIDDVAATRWPPSTGPSPTCKSLGRMEQAKRPASCWPSARKAGGRRDACVFDRGGYRYHGRVKALADGAREGGLKF